MNKKTIIALVLCAITVVALVLILLSQRVGPSPEDNFQTITTKDQGSTTVGINNAVQANNRFAFEMYNKLGLTEKGNVFFSPYSISTAMAMAYEGANGSTASEIQSVMHFSKDMTERRSSFANLHNRYNPTGAKYILNVANAFWAQKEYKFLDTYTSTLKDYYASKSTNLDFINDAEGSRRTINTWVEQNTNNKIKDLIPQNGITAATKLVLTNAVYFKGLWENQFDKKNTRSENFNLTATTNVLTPMMRSSNKDRFNYYSDSELQALEMTYQGEAISMLVLLPSVNNINSIESRLNNESIKNIRTVMTEREVDVVLPKFKFDTSYGLADSLGKLGMPTAFTTQADFSGMDGTKSLAIQAVIHKAYVDVNEEGTEAAAATGIIVGTTAMPFEPKPVFRADHPFIFFILDKANGNILFMGKIVDPTK